MRKWSKKKKKKRKQKRWSREISSFPQLMEHLVKFSFISKTLLCNSWLKYSGHTSVDNLSGTLVWWGRVQVGEGVFFQCFLSTEFKVATSSLLLCFRWHTQIHLSNPPLCLSCVLETVCYWFVDLAWIAAFLLPFKTPAYPVFLKISIIIPLWHLHLGPRLIPCVPQQEPWEPGNGKCRRKAVSQTNNNEGI